MGIDDTIEKIVSNLREDRRRMAREALKHAHELGVGVIMPGPDGLQYDAQWITRTESGGDSTISLGTILVVAESARGVYATEKKDLASGKK